MMILIVVMCATLPILMAVLFIAFLMKRKKRTI